MNRIMNTLSWITAQAWLRTKNAVRRLYVWWKNPRYRYLYCGKYVYRVPLEFTPDRISFYMEIRAKERSESRLPGWKEIDNPYANVHDTMTKLGFVPYLTVEAIYTGV